MSDGKEDLVCDSYQINEDLLEDNSEDGLNEYWTAVHKFYVRVKNKSLTELTTSQLDWLTKIEFDLSKG